MIWGLADRIRAECWLYRLESLMEKHEAAEDRIHTFDPALCEALLNGYHFVRGEAARALGELGAAAPPATSALLRALADESQWVRRSAEDALEKIWSGKLIPNRCEVHQRDLLDGSMLPSYGLYEIDDEATRELILRFPFANDSCNCGAEDKWVHVGDRRIPVRYCPDCRTGKETWRKGR